MCEEANVNAVIECFHNANDMKISSAVMNHISMLIHDLMHSDIFEHARAI